ncbi:MAG TPA: hypothetical protein VH187_13635 [Scandinavium sp.]|uniref:hypothetical protein n=1 Tax=Scandinavium sp. TaxID=2830653 RepID=UPI002E2EAA6E|nr:hypothetical protein [Scandinavium sp.]HEX4502173.1 hypothetical protein [Scandinavium sp.]
MEANVTGDVSDFMSRLMDISPELESYMKNVMAATKVLKDEMRKARFAARDVVVATRGHRR